MTSITPLAELLAPVRHIFLSPHYDDIALSCGGTAALLAAHGRAPIVTVIFARASDADSPLTSFAEFQHERWGIVGGDAIATRVAEEAAAAAILGTTIDVLPFADAIYRGDRYLNDDQLFGDIAADEAGLSDQIVATLALGRPPDGENRIYAPLAVGNHVDHQHAFAAGVALARVGWDVWFYEDIPYALHAGATARRVESSTVDSRPAAVLDVAPSWTAKIAAILTYRTQVPVIFRHIAPDGDPQQIERALAARARVIGGGVPAERFWRCQVGRGDHTTRLQDSLKKGLDKGSTNC